MDKRDKIYQWITSQDWSDSFFYTLNRLHLTFDNLNCKRMMFWDIFLTRGEMEYWFKESADYIQWYDQQGFED